MADDLLITADFSDIQAMNRELLGVAKSARASATTFEREYNRVEKTLNKNARASQTLYSNILKLDEPFKDAAKSASVFERELAKVERAAVQSAKNQAAADAALAREKEKLASKYVPLYAASKQYETALEEVNRAQQLGVISDKQRAASIEQLNADFAAGTGVFSTYAAEAGRRTNQLGVVTQQAGYQIGDFLVQVQSGTNWMVAFGQQATQLVGVLPLMGAGFMGLSAGALVSLAAGLGIAIPLVTAIGAAFMRTRKDTDEVSESTKNLNSELESLDSTLNEWIRTKKAAEAGITIEELLGGEGLTSANESLEAAKTKLQEIADFKDNFSALGYVLADGLTRAGQATGILENQKDLNAAALAYIEAVERIGDIRQKQAEDQYKTFAEEDRLLRQKLVLEQEIARSGKDSAAVRRMTLEQEVSNYNRVIDQQVKNNELTETQGRLLKEQNALVAQLAETSGKVNFSSAEESAQRLADKLGISLELARKLAGMGYGQEKKVVLDPRDPNYDPIAAGMQDFDYGTVSPFDPSRQPKEETSRGRSGGGGGSSAERRIEQLTQSLMTEQEKVEEWRTTQLELLQQYGDKELEIIGGQTEARLRIEQEYADRMADIRQQERSVRLTETSSMFSSLASLAALGGKRMLKVQATLSAAATTVAAYETAVKAAAEAKTIPGRIAAYASFLATGLGAVAQIKKVGGIGGGSGGGGAKGGAGASGADAAIPRNERLGPQRILIEGIDKDSLISGEQLSNIFEALYKENENRGFVFEVGR